MGTFNGTLNTNEIFSALYNMIISQEVFADNIQGDDLVDKARVDGGLYGDIKLFYATDVLASSAWGNDAEATNLLALDRPDAPECQAIVLNKFRQIRLTVDNYMSKRAFADEGTFSSFNSVMLGWIRGTKKVYDGTLYNAFIGTTEGAAKKATLNIDVDADSNSLGENVAKEMSNLFTKMCDYSRDYNDYGFLRRYAKGDIKVIWNSECLNQVKKIDLPSIFHDEALQSVFVGDELPARYFGTVITSSNVATYSDSTPTTGKPIDSDTGAYTPGVGNANGTIRTLEEVTVTVGGTGYHLFPGDEIPSGATIGASKDFALGTVYIEQADIMAKVYVKLPPYMSAFEVGTSFFNPRSLTENNFLTFGHNELKYYKAYPLITVKAI